MAGTSTRRSILLAMVTANDARPKPIPCLPSPSWTRLYYVRTTVAATVQYPCVS